MGPHPYPRPGMAPSGVGGLTEELGVGISCPSLGPHHIGSVSASWRTMLGPVDTGLMAPRQVMKPTRAPTFPTTFSHLPRVIFLNETLNRPLLSRKPFLGSPGFLGQSPNSSRPRRPSRSDPAGLPTPPPSLGAALNGSDVVTDSYLGPFPSVFLHFLWEVALDPLSGDCHCALWPPPSKHTSLCIIIVCFLCLPHQPGRESSVETPSVLLRGESPVPVTVRGTSWALNKHLLSEGTNFAR